MTELGWASATGHTRWVGGAMQEWNRAWHVGMDIVLTYVSMKRGQAV